MRLFFSLTPSDNKKEGQGAAVKYAHALCCLFSKMAFFIQKINLFSAIHSPVIYLNGTNGSWGKISCGFLPFLLFPLLLGAKSLPKIARLLSTPHLYFFGERHVSEKLANPAPLGLMGFGMTTILLNIHNAGFFPISAMILAMGLCYGGLAQIIAGIMEFKRGNTFGVTAFISYGTFWWSLVFLLVMPTMGLAEATPAAYMGWYLLMWGMFTLFMLVGTVNYPRVKQFVFASLTVLFFLLAARDFTGSTLIGTIAGFEGIICGASAIYLAMATVINEQFGRTVLPIGDHKKAAAVQLKAAA